MNEIIQINISGPRNTVEVHSVLKDFYSGIVQRAQELGLWDVAITKIVVTDSFLEDIEFLAKRWAIQSEISSEKDYSVVSKIMFNQNLNQPEYQIFIDFNVLAYNASYNYEITLGQILGIFSKRIVPSEIRELVIQPLPGTLQGCIKVLSSEWCSVFYRRRLQSQFGQSVLDPIDPNKLLIAFKRKLKKYLYQYNDGQSDNTYRITRFWYNYLSSIDQFFTRLGELDSSELFLTLSESEPSKGLIISVMREIELLSTQFANHADYDISPLKEAIKEFSAHYNVNLLRETEINFFIDLPKNPKDYFVGEIVDTEPRIVCFMDILGFSDLIDLYEKDITSTILQDIQESFSLAKRQLIQTTSNYEDFFKHLSYQTFSDNICISIPYFDNESDFLTNLNLISIYVRGFQMIMLSKNLFIRGGISTGSYYADENIIFSTGLVKAYQLESKKAVYPRVVKDNDIINKMSSYKTDQIRQFGLDNSIILDWENIAFLNPFGLIESSTRILRFAFEGLYDNDEKDPFFNSMNSFIKSISDITLGLLQDAEANEKSEVQRVKEVLAINLIRNKNNERILSKYIWLNEFLKWYEDSSSSNLKFKHLSELERDQNINS